MNGQVSVNIEEGLGVKQGKNKSSDHYKVYIAPLLDTLESADLGVWIGNVNVSVSGVADDGRHTVQTSSSDGYSLPLWTNV